MRRRLASGGGLSQPVWWHLPVCLGGRHNTTTTNTLPNTTNTLVCTSKKPKIWLFNILLRFVCSCYTAKLNVLHYLLVYGRCWCWCWWCLLLSILDDLFIDILLPAARLYSRPTSSSSASTVRNAGGGRAQVNLAHCAVCTQHCTLKIAHCAL